MEGDSSSLEFHDVEETEKTIPVSQPPAEKKNKFRTLSLRRRKSSADAVDLNETQKSATLQLKKRRASLSRLLSFGKKKKKGEITENSLKEDENGSQDTLSEEVEIHSDSAVSSTPKASKKKERQGKLSQDVVGITFRRIGAEYLGSEEGSRETLSEYIQVSSPVAAPGLRNTLRPSSVIELAQENKLREQRIGDEDSEDSFKSADSPVLCNPSEELAVDTARQGWPESGPSSQFFTESAFNVFADSEFVKEVRLEKGKKKKSLWKRLHFGERVFVYSKTPSDLLVTSVDGVSTMSQNQGAIKKERVRGRATAPARKSGEKSEKVGEESLNVVQNTPSQAAPEPAPPSPSTSSAPPPQALSASSPGLDENTLKKSAEVGSQILQQKKEEAGKRVSGDDLRKQLSEGLKNGSGKPKENSVKAQLSEITQGAAKTSASETITIIEKERKSKEEKKGETSADPKESSEEGEKSAGQSEDPSSSEAPPPTKEDMPSAESKKEHLYKILVIGELGTGKTSIIKRYVHQFFSQHYRATIGVDFALKVLNWDENSIIRLQLWDIAGQERFGNMTRVYYKEAVGAFIVFDVTRAATFDAVQKWKQDLDSKVQLSDGSPIPCILLANKCDQPKEGVVNNKNKMDEYCKENGFAGWFETSAKENINIEDAARALVLKILQNDKLIRTGERGHDSDRIALDGKSEGAGGSTCSC